MAEKETSAAGRDGPGGIYWRPEIRAWWPLYDHKPDKCWQFVRHGLGAIDVAAKWLGKGRRHCVQAGGHAGFWPLKLAELFDEVHTFEPEPVLFDCLLLNVAAENVTMYPVGLGARRALLPFKSHVSAGSWRIDPAGETTIEVWPIDSLQLDRCDALFLDVEGYEVEVLKGAAATIAANRPLILVELLPRSAPAIVAHLRELNYKQVARFGRDGIFRPA